MTRVGVENVPYVDMINAFTETYHIFITISTSISVAMYRYSHKYTYICKYLSGYILDICVFYWLLSHNLKMKKSQMSQYNWEAFGSLELFEKIIWIKEKNTKQKHKQTNKQKFLVI